MMQCSLNYSVREPMTSHGYIDLPVCIETLLSVPYIHFIQLE